MLRTPDGLQIDPPAGFNIEESMFALLAPESAPKNGKPPVRDNLVVRRRQVRPDSDLTEHAGQMVAELMKSIPSMDGLDTSPFDFSDGTKGLIVGYRFVSMGKVVLRQYHAIRRDGEVLTTLTITVDDERIDLPTRDQYFRALASARPA
ncbi:MAG TPA: hypothetical protein VIG99_14420 [Myxococcaceae bacterium]|jgi:hypothetical protein